MNPSTIVTSTAPTPDTSRPRVDADPAHPWRIEARTPDTVVLRHRSATNPQPNNWVDLLVAAKRAMPGAWSRVSGRVGRNPSGASAVVGAKRLTAEGQVFSMGEAVIHPAGFHHIGKGVVGSAYRFPEEVDAVTGGVVAVDAQAFEGIGGLAAMRGELGALSLCLSLRKRGHRCVTIPQVVVTDSTTPAPDPAEHEAFVTRWGFDWRAADLDAVRQRHAGSGLLWNVRYHAAAMPFEKYTQRPAVHWDNYQRVGVYRQRADHLAGLVKQLCPKGRVLDLGCGDGLFSHLFARHGAKVTGIDPEPEAITQAQSKVSEQVYADPAGAPRFMVGNGDAMPLEDESVQAVVMLDVIEHLPNPVSVLREAARVVMRGGHVLITTPAWQYGHWSDPVYHVCEYTMEQLCRQVQAIGPFKIAHTGQISGVYRDLIVVARKTQP